MLSSRELQGGVYEAFISLAPVPHTWSNTVCTLNGCWPAHWTASQARGDKQVRKEMSKAGARAKTLAQTPGHRSCLLLQMLTVSLRLCPLSSSEGGLLETIVEHYGYNMEEALINNRLTTVFTESSPRSLPSISTVKSMEARKPLLPWSCCGDMDPECWTDVAT